LGNFPSIGSYYNPQYTFGQNNGNTQWFTGHLDEVRIWSKVLTETEIRENMCKTLEGNETGLAAYFRFDQESGTGGSTTLYDLTSNGNDGTLNNMDATTDWVSSSVFNTWIGSEGTTTWATDANWSTGTAPVSTDNVGIYDYSLSSDPVIPSGTEVNHLLIGSSTLAEVSEGNTLDVNGNLLVNGTFTVASNAMASSGTGSLIVDGSAAGNVIVERYVDGGSGGYNHFVSAPISDATGNDLASDYNIYEYQDTLQNWNRIFTGNSLTSGIGYTTAYNSNKTISYTGTLNTGTVNVYVNSSNINAAYSDYNMVGNPYSSRINASAFVNDADNSEISGALYFWTDDHGHASGYTTDDFATWTITGSTGASANGGADTVTPNRYIESGQGFFVYAPTSGGAIKFKNSHQVHSSPRSFFTPEINTIQRVWLTLSNDEFNYSNDILIGFLEDATEGYDRLYDAVKNQGNENLSFYSIIENDDRNFVIQGLPIPTSEKEIKLGYFAKQAGIYTIDIDNMERFDGYSIVLVDKEMNITVNLLETDYSFTTASGEFDERFSLFISAKSSSVEEANQEVKIYSSENLIYLNIPQDENYCISVYDMLGKKVYSSIPSSIGFQSIDLGLKTGFYLVKVKNETSEYTEKVFLK
ncbi:MAG: T9SS type A sorting domain-containing protein, partial [Bacteroidetes bacterium]|nr:T9SS type A sorting domain-containing protein [Bacteroidota bacterium]